jgi:hypothetical protein
MLSSERIVCVRVRVCVCAHACAFVLVSVRARLRARNLSMHFGETINGIPGNKLQTLRIIVHFSL